MDRFALSVLNAFFNISAETWVVSSERKKVCVACASDYNYIITHALREGDRAFLILVNVFNRGGDFARDFRDSLKFY